MTGEGGSVDDRTVAEVAEGMRTLLAEALSTAGCDRTFEDGVRRAA